MTTPATQARLTAGLTAETAAKRLRIGVRYLLRLERVGFPFHKAEQAARIYGAPLSSFLPAPSSSGGGSAGGRERGQARAPLSPRGTVR